MSNDQRLASYQAAHAVTGRLIWVLSPLPTDITVRVSSWAPTEPAVRAYAHEDVDALHAWQAALGGELTTRQHSDGQVRWTLSAVVDGIPVEAWTLLDAPAEVTS
jgi:hypothetical protein